MRKYPTWVVVWQSEVRECWLATHWNGAWPKVGREVLPQVTVWILEDPSSSVLWLGERDRHTVFPELATLSWGSQHPAQGPGWRWVTRTPKLIQRKAPQETLSYPVTAQLFTEDQAWCQPSNYTFIHSTSISRGYSCFFRHTLCSPPFSRISFPLAPSFPQAPHPPTASTYDTLPHLPMVDFSLSLVSK